MGALILSLASFSCGGNKNYDEMTPEEQAKIYSEFQKDSLKNCTQNERLAKAFALGAFDRLPENNSYFKQDKVTCTYSEDLGCWICTVDFHVDRNNTYYQSSKTFHIYIWENFEGKKESIPQYKVEEVHPQQEVSAE